MKQIIYCLVLVTVISCLGFNQQKQLNSNSNLFPSENDKKEFNRSFKINKPNTLVDEILQIPRAVQMPVIDGVLDNIWLNVTAHPLLFYCGEIVPGSDLFDRDRVFDDHFSSFRLMWDEEYFYAFVSVVDDSLYSTFSELFFNNDLIDLHFDGGNEKSTIYDANDQEWYYVLNKHAAAPPELRGRGDFVFLITEMGYNLEIKIHKDSLYNNHGLLFPLEQGREIGFEISNTDCESNAEYRQDWLQWWTDSSYTWRDPSLFGTALLSERIVSDTLYIPYAKNGGPILDGIMEQWEGWEVADEVTLDKFENNDRPDNILTTWDDHLSSFWTMWDENYFYLFVKVTDEELDGSDKDSFQGNDCIVLSFDGGNEKSNFFDTNDMRWYYVYSESPGNQFLSRGKGEYIFLDTEAGYNFELRIPKDSIVNSDDEILFPLAPSHKIGFEVANGDRDGGVLNNIRHWWSSDADVNQKPALFGTAKLIPGQYLLIPPKISSPNGKEIWKVGTEHSITWRVNGIDSVKLEYTINNGSTWNNIVSSVPAYLHKYIWTVPYTPSDECMVKISNTDDSTMYDISDKVFTIKAPVPHAPLILSISDVPNDQGGKVYLRFASSDLDTNESALSYYSIWRSVSGFIWEWIANQPAHRFTEYAYTAETLGDKMPNNNGMHYFMISAHTGDPDVFYDSDIDSGYSVDNNAPLMPSNFAISNLEGKIYMKWNTNTEPDLSGYDLYRGTTALNTMKFASTNNTTYTDEHPGGNTYYTIRAYDIHGNLSPMAPVLTGVTNDDNKPPSQFTLNQNYPNPFNPSTKIRYEIPAESKVIIKVYDILGRDVVTLINDYYKPGNYEVEWNAGNFASGIYFYSITAGNFRQMKKMVLVK